MQNLQKNSHLLIFSLFLGSCTSLSTYRVYDHSSYRTELLVAPDRILLQCERLSDLEDEPKNRQEGYGFMIHILDEADSVLTIVQSNIIDKQSCFDRIRKIGQMQKQSKLIYFGSMGTLDDPRKPEKSSYVFPGKGTFIGNSRVLQFNFVKGDNGTCYTAHDGDICQSKEFPIHQLPF